MSSKSAKKAPSPAMVHKIIASGITQRKDIGDKLGLTTTTELQRLDVVLKNKDNGFEPAGRGVYNIKHEAKKPKVEKPKAEKSKVEKPAPSMMRTAALQELAPKRARVPRAQKQAWLEDWDKLADKVAANRFFGAALAPATIEEFMLAQREHYGDDSAMPVDIKNKKELEGFSPKLMAAQKRLADSLTGSAEPDIVITCNEHEGISAVTDTELLAELMVRLPKVLALMRGESLTEVTTTTTVTSIGKPPKKQQPRVLVMGCYNEMPLRVLEHSPLIKKYAGKGYMQLKFCKLDHKEVHLDNVVAIVRLPIALPPKQVAALRKFHDQGGQSYLVHGERGVREKLEAIGAELEQAASAATV